MLPLCPWKPSLCLYSSHQNLLPTKPRLLSKDAFLLFNPLSKSIWDSYKNRMYLATPSPFHYVLSSTDSLSYPSHAGASHVPNTLTLSSCLHYLT